MTAAEEHWSKDMIDAEARGYRRGQEDMRDRARYRIVKIFAETYEKFKCDPTSGKAELAVAELEILPLPAKETS